MPMRTPLLLLCLAASLAACGYGFVGSAPSALPEDVRSLAMDTVKNPTLDPDLPALVISRFRDEMTQRVKTRWTDRSEARGLVSLTIQRYYLTTELSDKTDRTLKYNANITLSATVRSKLDDRVIWQSDLVTYKETYLQADSEEDARTRAVEFAVRRLVDRLEQAY